MDDTEDSEDMEQMEDDLEARFFAPIRTRNGILPRGDSSSLDSGWVWVASEVMLLRTGNDGGIKTLESSPLQNSAAFLS